MTTNAQHTPGKWLYRPQEHDDWGIVRAAERCELGFQRVICQANYVASPDELIEHRRNRTDPAEANARLIAAAPDFAEAAPDAADILEHYAEYVRGLPSAEFERHPYIPAIEEAAAKLRAAILKATGEPK